jgi:hypothetical protein
VRAAGVYLHPDALILYALGQVPAGFLVSIPPVFRLPAFGAPDLVGRTLREALAGYQSPFPQPSDRKAHRAAFLKATGVRSWRKLEGSSRMCSIEEGDAEITFTPWRNGGSHGPNKGFQPFGAAPITCAKSVSDAALGAALLDALAKCE